MDKDKYQKLAEEERKMILNRLALLQAEKITQEEFIEPFVERRVAFQKTLDESERDELLEGFYKRKGFISQVERVIDEIKRLEQESIKFKGAAILFLDVDRFKEANDTYGHDFGDLVLKEIGKSLRRVIRRKSDFFGHDTSNEKIDAEEEKKPQGTVGRPGGDEMTACLFDTDEIGAEQVAENARQEVAKIEIYTLDGKRWIQTVSIGVAIIEPDDTADSVIKRADQAMYQAKKEKNKVVSYEEITPPPNTG